MCMHACVCLVYVYGVCVLCVCLRITLAFCNILSFLVVFSVLSNFILE